MIKNSEGKQVTLTPDEDAVMQEVMRLKVFNMMPLVKSLKNSNMPPERIARAFMGLEIKKMISCSDGDHLRAEQLTEEEREEVIKQIARHFEAL